MQSNINILKWFVILKHSNVIVVTILLFHKHKMIKFKLFIYLILCDAIHIIIQETKDEYIKHMLVQIVKQVRFI